VRLISADSSDSDQSSQIITPPVPGFITFPHLVEK
jgi:hypothetical protein